jgi:hypothetical protein
VSAARRPERRCARHSLISLGIVGSQEPPTIVPVDCDRHRVSGAMLFYNWGCYGFDGTIVRQAACRVVLNPSVNTLRNNANANDYSYALAA